MNPDMGFFGPAKPPGVTRGVRTRMDGNTAVAYVAYRVNEICAIDPITSSSTMAELVDQWSADGVPNIWGNIPVVQEVQSEGGAAGAVLGALQSGAMTTTFTSSQALMLMLPHLFKIASQRNATVFHVATSSLATSSRSIFSDHADVLACRGTGFALLSSANGQEAHDSALLAEAATRESRVPFMAFFDGYRTSHEPNTLDLIPDDTLREMIPNALVRAHRARGPNPDAVTPYDAAVPGILERAMDRFAVLTGRAYRLFEYDGALDAERVLILMGSGAETARQTARALVAAGERVGVVQVCLYRPFSAAHLLAAIPVSVRSIAVLDQTKETGSTGEPLYLDVIATLAQAVGAGTWATMPRVIGGRYGLSSTDFSPAMAKAALDELSRVDPAGGFAGRISFTLAIDDDVSPSSSDTSEDEKHNSVEPLFELSGACARSDRTPYLKLLSELFGDRAQIANATGCSSICGGSLPVAAWTKDRDGRGPASPKSLFEANVEVGLGFRLAADKQLAIARALLTKLAPVIGDALALIILNAPDVEEHDIRDQRIRIGELKTRLRAIDTEPALDLLSIADYLVRRSVWIVDGDGDGWGSDIGHGGLGHVFASDRDVNILVLNTEYPNTGGQASKATSLAAVGRFAAAAKRIAPENLALLAVSYGNVYVAQVAIDTNAQQTLDAFREAEAFDGPSLIIACGDWPLMRFNPVMQTAGRHPFQLDSPRPTIPFKEYAYNEFRYASPARTLPDDAATLLIETQAEIVAKYRKYEALAALDGSRFTTGAVTALMNDA